MDQEAGLAGQSAGVHDVRKVASTQTFLRNLFVEELMRDLWHLLNIFVRHYLCVYLVDLPYLALGVPPADDDAAARTPDHHER